MASQNSNPAVANKQKQVTPLLKKSIDVKLNPSGP